MPAETIDVASLSVRRLLDQPILHVENEPSLEGNVNGPSLIRVPDWIEAPLGKFYLYVAHHQGRSIRLAYADALTGPWRLYAPGALRLDVSGFPTDDVPYQDLSAQVKWIVDAGADGRYAHIASPDVVIDETSATVRMYYHGRLADGTQMTRVATSSDGLNFTARDEILGLPYFRVFPHGGAWFALAMPGIIYRSDDGLSGFEAGPRLFDNNMRHSALLIRNQTLFVFWTRVGDSPERILVSSIDLADDWYKWCESEAQEVLRPGLAWEGARLPSEPSRRGGIMSAVNQLRDPGILDLGDQIALIYSGAGEQGLGMAEVTFR